MVLAIVDPGWPVPGATTATNSFACWKQSWIRQNDGMMVQPLESQSLLHACLLVLKQAFFPLYTCMWLAGRNAEILTTMKLARTLGLLPFACWLWRALALFVSVLSLETVVGRRGSHSYVLDALQSS